MPNIFSSLLYRPGHAPSHPFWFQHNKTVDGVGPQETPAFPHGVVAELLRHDDDLVGG